MSKLIDNIRRLSAMIKNETRSGGNTAVRVGGLFEEIADELDMKSDSTAVEKMNREHDGNPEAHAAIRESVRQATERLDREKLDKTGDGKDVCVTFLEAQARANVGTGETVAVLFGKVMRWFTDLRALAFKDKVTKGDLESGLQTEIEGKANKADIPTSLPASDVYAWAKAPNKPDYNFNEIGDAPQVNVDPGVVCRKTIVCNAKTGQGWTSRIALGLTNPTARYSPALISIGAADLGDTWIDFTFDTNGRIYSPAGEFALVSQIPASLPANGGNADTLDGIHANGFVCKPGFLIDFNQSNQDGIYTVTPDSKNSPIGSYGCLAALNTGGAQMYLYTPHAMSQKPALYVRNGFDGAKFSLWGRVAFTEDIPTTLPASSITDTETKVMMTKEERSKLGKFEFTNNGKCLANNKELATVDQLSGDQGGVGDRDWNTIVTPGFYYTHPQAWGANTPEGAYPYGLLVVCASGEAVSQSYYESGYGTFWYRTKYDGTFSDWTLVAKASSVPATTADLPEAANKRYVSVEQRAKLEGSLEVAFAGIVDENGGKVKSKGRTFYVNKTGYGLYTITHLENDAELLVQITSIGGTVGMAHSFTNTNFKVESYVGSSGNNNGRGFHMVAYKL